MYLSLAADMTGNSLDQNIHKYTIKVDQHLHINITKCVHKISSFLLTT